MLAKIVGIPLSFIVFVSVTWYASYFVDTGIPAIIGCTCGAGVWYFFRCIDDRRLDALLRPKPAIWHVPMPVAWGILKDVFDGSIVRTKEGVIAAWSMKREDKSRGQLAAVLNLLEHGGCGPNGAIVPQTIAANAQLTPHGSTTGVTLTFEIFAPSGTDLVEDIIRKCQRRLQSEVTEYGLVRTTHEAQLPDVTLTDESARGNRYVQGG